MSDEQVERLARYILDFLQNRNGGELEGAIGNMRMSDYRLLHEELKMILKHGGKPPNWVN